MDNLQPQATSGKGEGDPAPPYTLVSTFRYHTFWRRFWAGIIDGLVFLPLEHLDNLAYPFLGAGSLAGLWFVFNSFAFLAYSVLLHGFFGCTIGKFVTGVTVLDVTEQPLSLKQALLRDSVPILLTGMVVLLALPKALSGANPVDWPDPSEPLSLINFAMFLWFVAEVVTMLWNDKRRAVHDFIAGSVVVRK